MPADAALPTIRGRAGHEESRTQWVGADSILFATAHRPWPAPMAPWVMTQRWNDLLFLHYPVAPEMLRPLVPEVLTLDTYRQRAWVSVTPFWINHLRPPGVPSLPWISHFSEINVRTYVTYDGKPGVYFFSLDASNLSAVWGARVFYRLPYWQASMKVKGRGGPRLEYRFQAQHGPKPAELRCSYGPASERFHARPGSIEHFLTERYCLYAVQSQTVLPGRYSPSAVGRCRPADVRSGAEHYGPAGGHPASPQPELVYFSRELRYSSGRRRGCVMWNCH